MVPQNNKEQGTLSDRFPIKAQEGNNVRPTPYATIKPTEVTKDELSVVDGCPTCGITFDTGNEEELVRAMVIGEVLNTPRCKCPFGKRR